MNNENNSELMDIAMQIILHSGNAREFASEALNQAKEFYFVNTVELMNQAEAEMVLAHKSQTDIIQNEAKGANYEINLLFIHAQDTLMTINSEIKLIKELISILKILKERSMEI